MSNLFRVRNLIVLGTSLSFTFGSFAYTQTVPGTVQKEASVSTRASGTFEVKLTPQTPGDKSAGAAIGRMSIDKQFLGDLKGTSKGEMLAVGPDVKGLGRLRRDGAGQWHTQWSHRHLHPSAQWHHDARRTATQCHCGARLRHR